MDCLLASLLLTSTTALTPRPAVLIHRAHRSYRSDAVRLLGDPNFGKDRRKLETPSDLSAFEIARSKFQKEQQAQALKQTAVTAISVAALTAFLYAQMSPSLPPPTPTPTQSSQPPSRPLLEAKQAAAEANAAAEAASSEAAALKAAEIAAAKMAAVEAKAAADVQKQLDAAVEARRLLDAQEAAEAGATVVIPPSEPLSRPLLEAKQAAAQANAQAEGKARKGAAAKAKAAEEEAARVKAAEEAAAAALDASRMDPLEAKRTLRQQRAGGEVAETPPPSGPPISLPGLGIGGGLLGLLAIAQAIILVSQKEDTERARKESLTQEAKAVRMKQTADEEGRLRLEALNQAATEAEDKAKLEAALKEMHQQMVEQEARIADLMTRAGSTEGGGGGGGVSAEAEAKAKAKLDALMQKRESEITSKDEQMAMLVQALDDASQQARSAQQAAVEAVGMAESVVESAIESAEAALSEADDGSGDEAPK